MPSDEEGELGHRDVVRPRGPMSPSMSTSSMLSASASTTTTRVSGRSLHEEPRQQLQQQAKPFWTRKVIRMAVAMAAILSAIALQQRQAATLRRALAQAVAAGTAAPQTAVHNITSANTTASSSPSSSSSLRIVESLLADGLTQCGEGVGNGGTGGTLVSRWRNCTEKGLKNDRQSGKNSTSDHREVDVGGRGGGNRTEDRSNANDGVDVRTSAAEEAAATSNLARHAVVQIPAHLARGNVSLLGRVKVPVVVWPLCETGIGNAVSLHLQTNGIQESPYLELSHNLDNFDPNVVWIGDAGSGASYRSWCRHFYDRVWNATKRRKDLGLSTSWPIYIIDYTDYSSRQRCQNVERLVGSEFVLYSKRSVVRGRRWKSSSSWVELGRVAHLRDGNVTYRHTPFIVRTDTIASLQSTLKQRGLALQDPIERIHRPVDVTHLWPRSSRKAGSANDGAPASAASEMDRGGVGEVESHLRTLVSDEIWGESKLRNWTVRVGLAGSPTRVGRQSVSSAYLDAMLATKIMVVTQRDGWEDHYRLFEALVSGAMVMTDRMLSLPSGLTNGTSLVEFGSLDELMRLLEYYLNHEEERLHIAAEGRRVAMLRHRSWHRIEEVIFGRPLTICEEGRGRGGNRTEGCPYVVHANEAIQFS